MSESEAIRPGEFRVFKKPVVDTYECYEMQGTKSDLSGHAIDDISEYIKKKYSYMEINPTQLIVNIDNALTAGRIAEHYNIPAVVLLKSVPYDYWALVFNNGAITIDCEGA